VATVPIGYLVAVALVTWCTLFALAPMRGGWIRGRLSWMFGFILNELPFVAFAWLLASTLLAIAQGDLRSPMGWTAFGLALLTTAGLAVIVRRALRTRPAVQHALAIGLGAHWRTAIDAPMAGGLRRRLPLASIMFAPLLVRRRNVERVADIPYGEAGKWNRLDVYRDRARPSGGPILVHLHGGGFRSGRKNREARPLLYRLAGRGWVCISANYRLSPAASFPDHLVDVKKVIAWAREHGQEFGADPRSIFIAGSSAGGHLASMAALTPNDPSFQPGFERADTSVAAAISMYGYYGPIDTGQPVPSSPMAYVHPDAPPFFVAHGDQDTYAPVDGARRFATALRTASMHPVVYAELPGAQHSFDLFHSIRFEALVDGIQAFAAWVRSSTHSSGRT